VPSFRLTPGPSLFCHGQPQSGRTELVNLAGLNELPYGALDRVNEADDQPFWSGLRTKLPAPARVGPGLHAPTSRRSLPGRGTASSMPCARGGDVALRHSPKMVSQDRKMISFSTRLALPFW
jgi:hypothetical protein